jgi:hypothetical protein
MPVEKIGTSGAEKEAAESLRCRQVVAEIMSFGVSQREILRIMHLLSLELEDRNTMSALVEILRPAIEGSAAPLGGLIVES